MPVDLALDVISCLFERFVCGGTVLHILSVFSQPSAAVAFDLIVRDRFQQELLAGFKGSGICFFNFAGSNRSGSFTVAAATLGFLSDGGEAEIPNGSHIRFTIGIPKRVMARSPGPGARPGMQP